MSNVRTPFYNALESEIKKNPQMKSSFNQLSHPVLMRLFDQVPCWLDSKPLKDYLYQFKIILLNMKTVRQTENGFVLSAANDKKLIENFEKNIIRNACDDLLDKQGSIKPEILDLFDCKKPLSDTNVYCLVSAYVSSINQEIYEQTEQLSGNYIESVGGFYAHFKANYSAWIIDIMKERNKNLTIENVGQVQGETICDKFFNGKLDKEVAIGAGIGLGAVLLSGLTVAGVLLFKAISANNGGNDSGPSHHFRK